VLQGLESDQEAVMQRLKAVGVLILSLVLVLPASGLAAPPTKEEVAQEKQEIRKKTKEILGQLYKAEPSAKTTLNKAAGYAVFSNFGMKIFVAGSGTGKGLAVSNKTKKEVFMKMIELQGGLGMGVKKFNLVWVFETPDKLDAFVNSGWELGAQTSAAAKVGDKGGAFQGAMQVSPGVWVYQLTESGLALELTAKGTKYYKNDELN
jgi:lipid-binding SYLF domain-containing protein